MSNAFRRYSGADGMRRRADLHTHTTASDGQYTPRQLVCRARAAGIGCLAITDHDTTGGLEEGLRAGAELGLTVIHILGLEDVEVPVLLGTSTSWAWALGRSTPRWRPCAAPCRPAGRNENSALWTF